MENNPREEFIIGKVDKSTRFETLSLYIFLLIIFLLPVLFIPSGSVPLQSTKTILVVVGTLLATILWAVSRLKDGLVKIQKTPLLIAIIVLPVVALLSGLFSSNTAVSFIGQGSEVGAALFMVVVAFLALIIPSVIKSRDRIFYSYLALILSFLLIALFQIARLVFDGNSLSFGIFNSLTQNPVGTWKELGIFFGLSALLSVITLELITLSRAFKVLLYVAFVVSLFLAFIVNFTAIWYILGIFSIIFFVYLFSFSRKVSYVSLVTLLVALVFIFSGISDGKKVNDYFKLQDVDVRPSWSATFDIMYSTFKEDPLLGSGPNRFVNEWLKAKPVGLNNTVFWNTDFNYGIGLIPTFFITQGILGILAWLSFFGLFIWVGFRAILRSIPDIFSRYLIISSFIVALYLWIFSVIYVPSTVLFTLAFIFTGLFVASLAQDGLVKTYELSLFKEPRIGFISILSLVAVIVVSLAIGYVYVERYIASIYYQSSIVEYNQKGNLDEASANINRAARLSPIDTYYQSLSDIDIARMNAIINRKDLTPEAMKSAFQEVYGSAITNAQQATAINSTNYQNWLSLGRVYEAVLPLGISGAYDNAKAMYIQALSLNSRSPALLLSLARLEAVNKKYPEAKKFISEALSLKNDYTEAIFLLSQIQVAEGNTKDAILSVESASFISPNDPGIFFQLGVLRYNEKDYKGAIDALARAVTLNSSYSNARYFLGLSLAQVNDYKNAIEQFTVIQQLNSDNSEVALILKNLKAGKSPFVDAKPPVDSKPEKRAKLPIKEK
ncbi:MAG: tetratricopeptide repeat protein [Candidatus Taylorbacteria bacterium]|nr:tetratricopeptide repeat protein [Candidatus Taylorbacteria bacterium]